MERQELEWGVRGVLRYRLELPIETPSNNIIKGMHFQAYRSLREKWRTLVEEALKNQELGAPIEKSFLVVERYCSGSGLDWDNAYGGLKPFLDCLVVPSSRNPDGLGLIVDDGPKHMPIPPFFRQLPAKPGLGKTVVSIYDLQ